MPRKKPLKGAGEKEQRQYEHIKESAEKSGRYGDRAEEVAARPVMKQHKEKGHKKGEQVMLAGILWAIVIVLVVLWLIGFLALHAGGLIHLLLVIAVIVLLYNLFVGRRARV